MAKVCSKPVWGTLPTGERILLGYFKGTYIDAGTWMVGLQKKECVYLSSSFFYPNKFAHIEMNRYTEEERED